MQGEEIEGLPSTPFIHQSALCTTHAVWLARNQQKQYLPRRINHLWLIIEAKMELMDIAIDYIW